VQERLKFEIFGLNRGKYAISWASSLKVEFHESSRIPIMTILSILKKSWFYPTIELPLDQWHGTAQISMDWTHMPQFYMNLNIQSDLSLRLKWLATRLFSCASFKQPCLYFPMSILPSSILHRQTYKIPMCFNPAMLGGQRPSNLQVVSVPNLKTISQRGWKLSVIPMKNLVNP
jgi:hypothetical protein